MKLAVLIWLVMHVVRGSINSPKAHDSNEVQRILYLSNHHTYIPIILGKYKGSLWRQRIWNETFIIQSKNIKKVTKSVYEALKETKFRLNKEYLILPYENAESYEQYIGKQFLRHSPVTVIIKSYNMFNETG